jgi:hypothetical protein
MKTWNELTHYAGFDWAGDRRQLVAALERQTNLFDGRELQIGLGLKVVAHGGKQP